MRELLLNYLSQSISKRAMPARISTVSRRYIIQWYVIKIWPSALATTSEFLRANSHKSVVAGPPTIFTSRERKVVAEYAEDFCTTKAANVKILL